MKYVQNFSTEISSEAGYWKTEKIGL